MTSWHHGIETSWHQDIVASWYHPTCGRHDSEDLSAPGLERDAIEKAFVLPAAPDVEADVAQLQVRVLEAVVRVAVARGPVRDDRNRNAGKIGNQWISALPLRLKSHQ